MSGQAFTSYSVDNDRRFRDAITRAQAVCSDLRIPFGQILADFYKSEKAIWGLKGPGQYPPFKNSGGYNRVSKKGVKTWVPQSLKNQGMSPYQVEKIKKVGFDYPLLVRTGSLAASLSSATANGAVAIIGATVLTIGTTVHYGVFHQSDDPRKKIPLRKFLFIGPEAAQFATSEMVGRPQRWLNIMNDYVIAQGRLSGAFQ